MKKFVLILFVLLIISQMLFVSSSASEEKLYDDQIVIFDLDVFQSEDNNQYNVNYIVKCGKEKIELELLCKFAIINDNNAYNDIIFTSKAIQLNNVENKNISDINVVIETQEYTKSHSEIPLSDYKRSVLTFKCNGIFMKGIFDIKKETVDVIKSLNIITSNDDLYVNALVAIQWEKRIGQLMANSSEVNYEEGSWAPVNDTNDDFQKSISNPNIVSNEEPITNKISPLTTSTDLVNSIRAIVNNDSWFKNAGISAKFDNYTRRFMIKRSVAYGRVVLTDILITQYTSTCEEGMGHNEATYQLQILYNVYVWYYTDNDSYTDDGQNSGGFAIRNAFIGIKTPQAGNRDFIIRAEQTASFNEASDSSVFSKTIKKLFYKSIPYGNYVEFGVDVLSEFASILSSNPETNIGVFYYDDNPEVHYSQNNGFVRSIILYSDAYALRTPSHYLRQYAKFKELELLYPYCNDSKYFTYQTKFEVAYAGSYGIESLGYYSNYFSRTYS